MRRFYMLSTLLALLLVANVGTATVASPAKPNPPPRLLADQALLNGRIVTVDDDSTSLDPGTIVEAMAVRDGKIVALGRNGNVLPLIGKETQVIDLQGRMVLPGIIDTHSHLMQYSARSPDADVMKGVPIPSSPDETWESIKARASEEIQQQVAASEPDEWIAIELPGSAIGPDGEEQDAVIAARNGLYTRDELDGLAPDNPVYIKSRTSAITNSLAQEIVHRDWYGPEEPDMMREDTGFSSNTLNRIIPSDYLVPDLETLAEIYRQEQDEWAATGVTTWSSSVRSLSVLAAYQLLDRRGEIGIRFAYTPAFATPTQVLPEMRGGTEPPYGTDHLWFAGGSMRGIDSSYPGILTTLEPPDIPDSIKERENLNEGYAEFVEDGVARGVRIAGTHTAGDQALDIMLDAIEAGSARAGLSKDEIRAKRHAIDHCTLNPRPDQIPRLLDLGITMSCAPKYIEMAPRIAEDYGEQYLVWNAPVRSLIEAGVPTVLEQDTGEIVDIGTAFHSLDVLVNREVEGEVWSPSERIHRAWALKMSTIWAADYVLRKDVLGSLEVGKFADFIVLDRDFLEVPNEEIGDIKVLMTGVGGDIVYRSPDF